MATFSDGLSHPNSLDFPFHSSSSDDMRQHLQNLLDGKEKQLQQAAALGERLLAQRVELEERVRLLQEMDADKSDEITADMRERYRELADAVRTWDFGNVQLTTAFTSSSANTSITSQSFEVQVHEPLRDEPERPKPVPGTSAAQSRRAKNAAHRADDVEFAFEIGSGLLTEVRRLQSLLAERDKAIQDMKEEKDDLEKSAESLRGALKSQEQSTDKYKEENWNLEVTLQELRIQFADSQSTVQRLESEHKRLTRQLNKAREATDQHKNEAERLKNSLEDLKANHETAIAQARKQAASLQRDKSDLQQSLDSLKAEMARLNRRLPRMGSPMTPEGRERSDLLTPHDREMDDVFSPAPSTNRRRGDTSAMFSADGEYDSSPDVSPSRPFQAPNHPSNEVEALQQRLAHAQRQINTLKSTLQREKELKIEYRKRLDGSPAIGTGLNTEEFVSDEDTEDGTPGTGKKPRRLGTFSVGRGGRGRSRGRGGITLIQRLEHAARSLTPEYDGDEDFGALTSTPPQLTTLPVFFGGGAEADDEPEPDYHDEEPAVDPPSNRGSLDGLDPAFANVLRRSSSSGSLPYNRSPLRQAVVSRTLPRRSRGGAAFQEARPASLVGQPEALAAELFGTGIGMDSVAEIETAVATAEFGCQTEFKEASPQLPPPIQITPADPETSDFGVQVQVEPEVPEQKLVIDISTQTDPEPIRQPKVAIERADIGVQHEIIGFSRSYAESSIETDPTVERKSTPPASLPVISLHAEVQTLFVQTAQIEVQTLPILAPEKVDVEMQTVSVSSPLVLGFDGSHTNDGLWRDDTIMQPALSHDTSGDTTIYGGIFASEHEQAEEEFDDAITETGVETDTDADYQDARQSIVLTTPTASMEEYQSMQTFSDEEGEEDDDDAESIKASMLAYRRDTESEVLPVTPPPERAPTGLLPVTYESQAVQAEAFEEPAPVLVSAPGFVSTPELVSAVVPEAPKPELREISVQTDRWVSTPPASPVHSRGTSLLGAFKVSGVGTQQFQYIAPHSAGPVASVTPIHSVPPSPSAVRDSVATIIPVPRSLSHDRRQSIELALSSADENTPRSRIPSVAPAPVDKSRPPMMMLPPPPRAPPPPNSMPPPHFIPERRIPTSSISSHDVAPGRPISPPPTELIQRATTPTFGSLRGGLPRQHGSSLPPAALGLASRPSTHSFRSAANATSHVHGVAPPTIVSIFGRDRDRVREMSTTSLQSDRSLGSGRSSMSSDNHYYPARSQSRATNAPQTVNGFPQNGAADPSTRGTDPAVLHAITQTMIGEFLYKYTRRTIGRGHGEKRHKRFFWVHPYTRTLYWSDADPGSSNVSESSAKSAYIEGVRSVLDPNPLPPGLHQYSVVVSTPFREMKFTAPTKERHDIWLNALQYLLTRPGTLLPSSTANGPNGAITGPGAAPLSPITGRAELPLEDTRPDHHNTRLLASPQSFRSGRSLHVSGDTWGTTPRGQRSTSQLSMGGSIGKRSGTPAAEYLRYAGPEGPYSPTKSFEQVQGGVGEDEELDFELHDESMSENGFEGLENVRACCDGLHTVGGHHHHHPHHHHPHRDDPPPGRSRMRDGHLDTHAHADPPRPSSPAWSFRSRSGSTASHDGGLFSGKLRFGSRRSAKTSTATSAMEVHTQLQPA